MGWGGHAVVFHLSVLEHVRAELGVERGQIDVHVAVCFALAFVPEEIRHVDLARSRQVQVVAALMEVPSMSAVHSRADDDDLAWRVAKDA